MNESFFEFRRIVNFKETEIFYQCYDKLIKSSPSYANQVVVESFGGGTLRTEFSFLTGIPMHIFPGYQLPYCSLVKNNLWSLPWFLRNSYDYSCIAVHPYNRTFWNRKHAYPLLGFEEFIDINAFTGHNPAKNNFVSDHDTYSKIIHLLNLSKKPLFLFCVTIQNHGPYHSFTKFENCGLDPEFIGYIELIQKSINALTYLKETLTELNREYILVHFGDHAPALKATSTNKREELLSTPLYITSNCFLDFSKFKNETIHISQLGSLLLDYAELLQSRCVSVIKAVF